VKSWKVSWFPSISGSISIHFPRCQGPARSLRGGAAKPAAAPDRVHPGRRQRGEAWKPWSMDGLPMKNGGSFHGYVE